MKKRGPGLNKKSPSLLNLPRRLSRELLESGYVQRQNQTRDSFRTVLGGKTRCVPGRLSGRVIKEAVGSMGGRGRKKSVWVNLFFIWGGHAPRGGV